MKLRFVAQLGDRRILQNARASSGNTRGEALHRKVGAGVTVLRGER